MNLPPGHVTTGASLVLLGQGLSARTGDLAGGGRVFGRYSGES